MENVKRYYSKHDIAHDILEELFNDDSVFIVSRDEMLQKLVDAEAYSCKSAASRMGELSKIAEGVGFSVERNRNNETIYVKRKERVYSSKGSFELGHEAKDKEESRILNAIGVYYSAIGNRFDEVVTELQKLRIDVSEEVLEDIIERVIKKIL